MNPFDPVLEEQLNRFLEQRIHRKNWEMWFSSFRISAVSTEQNEIVFTIGNLFLRDWVINKYSSLLAQAVKEVFGVNYRFRIEYETVKSAIEDLNHERSQVSDPAPVVKKRPLSLCSMNPQFQFQHFIPGEGNHFAYNAAMEVASHPGKYNPLFIYGGVGLGKTHLLQAVGHFVMNHQPQQRVIYLSSEQFLNELVESIKSNKTDAFRDKFRKQADILLIDDIQFLIGKAGIQNELFHTFNALFDQGKQIAFCSDRTPNELGTFHQRLISRFQMGLVAETTPPDMETRVRIIQSLAHRESLELEWPVIQYLALHVTDNIRTIQGLLVKMVIAKKLGKTEYGLPQIQNALKDLMGISPGYRPYNRNPEQTLMYLIQTQLPHTMEELVSGARSKSISDSRKVAMFVGHKQLGINIMRIAQIFEKSHSTVIYSIQKVEETLKKGNKKLQRLVDHMIAQTSPNVGSDSF